MFENIFDTIILGLIQGLAEWLPVSSTAHLRIAEHFMGLSATPLLGVSLHVGTLVVVIFYFRRDIKGMLIALTRLDFRSEYGQLIPLIIVATIPTAVIGLLYVEYLEDSLQTILVIGVTFLIGASLLYVSRFGKENRENMSVMMTLITGAAQGFAVFPGLSRSGTTISTTLLLGLKREKAFQFSFLLSIPAITGDLAIEAIKQRGQLAAQTIAPIELLVGVVVAMVVGYIAIRLVSELVRSKKFHYFAIYTWTLGAILVALALTGH